MNRILPHIANGRLSFFALLVAGAMFVALGQQSRPEFNVKNVSVAEAKALVDAGAVVVDVREQDKFDHRHIPGAILLPLAMLRLGVPASFSPAKDKPVLVYCGDGVTTGPEGTELLSKAGYVNAVNLEAGIAGWAAAGLPVQQ